MTLYEDINGQKVEVSAEREAEIRAEWAANDQKLAEMKAHIAKLEKIEQYSEKARLKEAKKEAEAAGDDETVTKINELLST